MAIFLLEKIGHDGSVGFRGRADWFEVGEVERLAVDCDVLDEEDDNLVGLRLSKGFRSRLSQG